MDGYAATRELHRIPELVSLPVIAMTAHTMYLPDLLPGISIQTGLRMCNRNRRLYREMLREFRETSVNAADDIRSHLASGESAHPGAGRL